jgi:hypothetical protein
MSNTNTKRPDKNIVLEGKTISRVVTKDQYCLEIYFADGTEVVLAGTAIGLSVSFYDFGVKGGGND